MMKKAFLLILALLLLGSFIWTVSANPESFSVHWWTIDAGGGHSSGGSFALTGTLGQSDTGTMIGGDYVVNGGFWNASGAALPFGNDLYLPYVTR